MCMVQEAGVVGLDFYIPVTINKHEGQPGRGRGGVGQVQVTCKGLHGNVWESDMTRV